MIDKIILKVFSVKCINGSKYQIKSLKIKILRWVLLEYLILISLIKKKYTQNVWSKDLGTKKSFGNGYIHHRYSLMSCPGL